MGTQSEDRWYDLARAAAFETTATSDDDVLSSEPFTLSMLAFGAVDPIVLVDTVITDGVLASPEGILLVESGQLDGVLTPERAMAVCIESANLPLFDLLYAVVSAEHDVDHDGNDTKESWAFGLSFATTPCWLF